MRSRFLRLMTRAQAWWLWMHPRLRHLMLVLQPLLRRWQTLSEFCQELAPGEMSKTKNMFFDLLRFSNPK